MARPPPPRSFGAHRPRDPAFRTAIPRFDAIDTGRGARCYAACGRRRQATATFFIVMSLTVHARRKLASPDDRDAWQTPAPPHNELAGFESWRTAVWGSGAVKRLGLRLLPSLATGDLYVSGQALDELDAEVRQLQRSLVLVVNELVADGVHIVANADAYETVRFRLANIAEAVRLARALPEGGEVVIG